MNGPLGALNAHNGPLATSAARGPNLELANDIEDDGNALPLPPGARGAIAA